MPTQSAAAASPSQPPDHLDPSELGTKQYWDNYYQEDLANLQEEDARNSDVGSLSAWFDDVNAPQKILRFLSSPEFPLAPCHFLSQVPEQCPSVIDLGTGNGQTLLQLRLRGFRGQMVGVDYSKASIELARELGKNQDCCENIKFEVMDIIRDLPHQPEGGPEDKFDLVLDKGTFDAVSLSGDVADASTSPLSESAGNPGRIHTLYPVRALRLVKPGGFLLVTSCNWTQQELIQWFTTGKEDSSYVVSVWKTIEYPKFKFGGHEGQGVCTVCFKKASKGEEERDE